MKPPEPFSPYDGNVMDRVGNYVLINGRWLLEVPPIDESSLGAIAELICGSSAGGGGGYTSPGPYRSMNDIHAFFRRAGVTPQGQSETRKWFVLESLQSTNGKNDLERILLRLASPKEYPGYSDTAQQVLGYLNNILQVEGLQVDVHGVDPYLLERKASAPDPKAKEMAVASPPDFDEIVGDEVLAKVLLFRWQEVQKCVQAEAYLSAVVMMGSVLEGVLLHKFEKNLEIGNRARNSPQDKKTGKPKPVKDWGLSAMIDVAHEVGWLEGDVKRFSHALRESRNLIHPYVQRQLGDVPTQHTCSICWEVVRAAITELSRMA